jgi:phenylacetate-CoA ligase
MSFLPTDLTDDRRRKIQNKGLKRTVAAAFENSSFYREKWQDAGIRPEDINSASDLHKLPFTDKEDLQEGYPFPLRSVPFSQITRIHASSGTTGKRKILCYTQKDVDDWADMFARCYEIAGLSVEDRVQIAVGYGLWTAGAGFQAGCERFGAMAIPVGPANAEMHCEMMVDLGTTVFCSTASMALLIAEEIYSRGIRHKIKLKKIIMGAERHSDAMRSRIKALTGVDHIFDIYGLTELYGPGTGLDCPLHQGIHFWDDRFIFEIIDPDTLEKLPDGTRGELVVTTLYKEASPLIRYRTHDVTRIHPGRCPCGSPFPRHGRIMGRTDDMFIFRAVNIYPSQIDHVISGITGVGSEYQIHLRHKEDGRDMMTVLLERSMGSTSADDIKIAHTVMDEIRRKVLVRTRVEMLDYGSLPRTQRKSQRVFDHRNQES